MNEDTDRQGRDGLREDALAWEIPSHNLPPVPYRDMPEPEPLGKILGPSVVLMGISIASGEVVLWPFIASQIGLVFMWAAVVGVLTQFFINMEIGRYTLATGETAVTGFTRLWKPWWWLFIIMPLLQNFWPGWATGSATALTFVFGGTGNIVLMSILGLIAIGIALTISPVVYQTVEKLIFLKVGAIIIFILIAVFIAIEAQAWRDLAVGYASIGRIPEAEGLTIAALLGAIAFAGAGGAGNLVQSNYIRDKGLGMGAHIPRIVSPITGEEEAVPSTGYLFPQDEANLNRWRQWWKVANQEQFWGFFFIGVLSITVFSVLAYSTVFGQDSGEGFDFIRAEGEVLKEVVAPWFGTLFWLIVAGSLFGGNLGILDYTSRIVADSLKVNRLRESSFWSESKIYFAIVWIMIVAGSGILLLGFEQPLVLLVISAVIAGMMMFVYSILLIWLNRRALPDAIKIRGIRLVAMIWAVLFFGYFSVLTVIDQARQFLGG